MSFEFVNNFFELIFNPVQMFNNYTKITTAFAAFALLFSTTSSAQCDPAAVVVDFSITMGFYPEETSWTFNDPSGVSIASDGPLYDGMNGETMALTWTLPSGDYTFVGSDSYGDGWDSGSATITVNGVATEYSVAASDPYVSNSPISQSWTISIGCEVSGCMDPDASNYNVDANAEDGSCCYNDIVTFNLYDDYGSGWVTNFTDGSQWVGGLEFEGVFYPFLSGNSLSLEFCVPAGCFLANMWVDFYSYDASWEVLLNGDIISSCINSEGCATASYSNNEVFFYTDDGSCVSEGCTDDTQCNFDPSANVDDGSCELESCGGCMIQESCNWDSFATLDDGSCDYDCIGCTDSTAINYDSTSTMSCVDCCSYCSGAFAGTISVGGGGYWDSEIYWSLMLGDVVIASQEEGDGSGGAVLDDQTVCLEPGCYSFVMADGYGDGWNGSEYVFTNFDGEIIFVGTWEGPTGLNPDVISTDNLDFNGGCTTGCSLADACNYDINADFSDDELCDYSCVGCMDPTASNYDPSATIDSGLCAQCDGAAPFVLTLILTDSYGDGWNDASFGVFSIDELLLSGDIDDYGNGTDGIVNICLAPGCYTVQVTSGTDPAEIGVSAIDQFGTNYGSISGGETLNIAFAGGSSEPCGFVGCTSPTANNYDFNADVDCLDAEGNSCCEEPAPNDLLENAEVIACASYSTGSLLNSNDDQELAGTEYGGIPVVSSGVWYVYNAAANEQVTVSTCSTPSNEAGTDYTTDTKIHVYTQSTDGLLAIASNDDGCESGFMSSAVFNAETGTDYYVYVSEYSIFTGGNDFILEVTCTTCDAFPSNDLSCDALALVNGETFSSSTCCSGNDPEVEFGAGTTYGTSYGVWFTFNSSDYDALDFLLLNTDGTQVGMNYYGYITGSDNTCADLDALGGAQITGNYDGITNAAFNDEMLENTTYYFCVFTTDLAGCGMFDFTISGVYYGCTDMSANNYDANATDDDGLCDYEGVNPSNNECEGAIALTCNTITSGSTGGANNIGSPVAVADCETAPGNGVWYSFVGDGQLHNISTCGSVIDSKINIYSAETACGGGSITEQEADPCGADLVTVNFAIGGGGYDEQIAWSLVDADGLVVAGGEMAGAGSGSVCLAEGDYTLTMIDFIGDGWNGGVAAFQNHIGESIGYFAPEDLEVGCFDTDAGATDSYDDGCAGYTTYPSWCGGYDDADFVSSEMCCACGGGESVGGGVQTEYATLTVSAYSMEPIFVAGDFTCVASASSNDYSVCTIYDQDDINLEFISTVGTLYYMLVGSEANTPEGSFDLEFTCAPVIEGCTNSVACNYVAEANVSTECDFFSCVCASATGSPLQVNMDHALGAGWSGATYTISDVSGLEIYTGGLDEADYAVDVNNYVGNDYGFDMVCLEAGCYTITTSENISFYANNFNITDVDGVEIVVGTNEGTWSFSVGGAVCGCTEEGACNYNVDATSDDGSCESDSCSGCTDMAACNYNFEAIVSDLDACCYENCFDVKMFDSYGDGWGYYFSDVPSTYTLASVDGTVVITGTLEAGYSGVDSHCLEDGCYTFEIDCPGDCGEISWELAGAIGGFVVGGSNDFATFSVGTPDACLVGCDISCACNYNPDVNIQDLTSCVFSGCAGCTYPDASNYDGAAVSDDGSCTFDIANPCPADLNGDGSISTVDLLIFLGAFGTIC